MKPEYFVTRIYYINGEPIANSEKIIDHITDNLMIEEAEVKYITRVASGTAEREDLLQEAANNRRSKSNRPTMPEIPLNKILQNKLNTGMKIGSRYSEITKKE